MGDTNRDRQQGQTPVIFNSFGHFHLFHPGFAMFFVDDGKVEVSKHHSILQTVLQDVKTHFKPHVKGSCLCNCG